jgi:hypothetical protein
MTISKTEVIQLAPTAQVFYDNLFENHEVCSYCFTQIREIDPFDDKQWGSRLASHPTEYRTIADGGAPGHDCEQHDEYGAIKTYHSRTFCGDCGRDGLADDSAQPLSTLMEFGANIHRELTRQGLICDLDALRDSLRRSSEQPPLQDYQTERLALATAHGVSEGVRNRYLS